ncbi:MAG TPA: glutamate--tRNA ligase family protein, partial [Acidimicrobiales bacterium]|nr:glutamate--tRNA ligase family protein [Acidimicrobiales bacterium]
MTPRVRFAPSPTGFLHVGSARTALFNWLFARSTGGTYVLRVEDTDAERNRPELTQSLLAELEWLGLDWDEGPLYQSERLDRHREVVDDLLARGLAYLCDADNTEVEGSSITDGLAVRFRMPTGQTVEFEDIVRGEVSFSTDDLEDFVIWRSNGSPMFLLANAVDDADMGITHAIRGEDLLSGVPKVLLLLDALGAPHPTYAHLPLLVNEQRKKLSKRRDDVSIADYRERGYLAEAMVNYLALLGWGPPDDVEI